MMIKGFGDFFRLDLKLRKGHEKVKNRWDIIIWVAFYEFKQQSSSRPPFGQVIRMTAEQGIMLLGMLLSVSSTKECFAEKYAATEMLTFDSNGMLIRSNVFKLDSSRS